MKAEDVTFDVIPGRNSDGAVAAGTCQLVRQSFDGKQKLYMTSARLEKGRNTAQLDVGGYPSTRRVRVHFRISRIIRNDAVGDLTHSIPARSTRIFLLFYGLT